MDITKYIGKGQYEKVEMICDSCFKSNIILFIVAKRNLKKHNGEYWCSSCSAKRSVKPQNKKEYWTNEKRDNLSKIIKSSEKHKASRKLFSLVGEKNGMFGKKHSLVTKFKMSKVRTGKKQSIQTIQKRNEKIKIIWDKKGRKTPLNFRIRSFLHESLNWYLNIYRRDWFKCTICGSKNKIDAHHKIPLSRLIKNNLSDKIFTTEEEKFRFLITCDDIIDKDLKNGITLCRECHKKEHGNWGSHNAK